MALKISIDGTIIEADEMGLAGAAFAISDLGERIKHLNGFIADLENQISFFTDKDRNDLQFDSRKEPLNKLREDIQNKEPSHIFIIKGKAMEFGYLKRKMTIAKSLIAASKDLQIIEKAKSEAISIDNPLLRWQCIEGMKNNVPLECSYFNELELLDALDSIQDLEVYKSDVDEPTGKIHWSGSKILLTTLFYDLMQLDLIRHGQGKTSKADVARLLSKYFVVEGSPISYEYALKGLKNSSEKATDRINVNPLG